MRVGLLESIRIGNRVSHSAQPLRDGRWRLQGLTTSVLAKINNEARSGFPEASPTCLEPFFLVMVPRQ